ncbi:MAG: DUF5017 domain-containing protein, partial [Pedobacter sp.]
MQEQVKNTCCCLYQVQISFLINHLHKIQGGNLNQLKKHSVMMKIKYGYLMLIIALITSCTKEEEVAPKFDVNAQATTIKAGEEVTFSITGDAKVISFYSGEFRNDYAYK